MAGRPLCCAPRWRSRGGSPPSGPSAARCIGWAGAGSAPSSSLDDPIRPTRRKKAVAEQAAAIVAAGGEGWVGDETTVREFPPLRAAWARRRQQPIVVLSGRNTRPLGHGGLNAATRGPVT